MATTLVAGGAGFIGSHLCQYLLHKNHRVICVDNLITGSEENILSFKKNQNFSFQHHDVTKSLFLEEDIHYIFHLASPASPNKNSKKSYIHYPIETLLVNSVGTYNLLKLSEDKKAKFLFSSSSEIYGDPVHSPQTEDYFGNVNPNGPRSVYDEAKRFGEAMTMAFVRKHAVDGRIVRIFNTYGPWMQHDDGRAVSNFITQALANKPLTIYGVGKQTRSFCHVDDMIIGIASALFLDNTIGKVINLGNPDERSILELARIIKELSDSNSEIIFQDLPEDDPRQRKPDISKAKKLLHWEPTVKLEEGLKKTIAYFRKTI